MTILKSFEKPLTPEEELKYLTKFKEEQDEHDEAIEKYNRLQAENHQYLFAGGDAYPWGGTSVRDFIAINDAPANIAGNPEYDAATHILGDGWSIPTKEQWQELIDRCQWEKKGRDYIVTGPS